MAQTDRHDDLLWHWLREGWKYRWKRSPHMRANKQLYVDKIKYEMGLIKDKGFQSYFLMLSDMVRWAKSQGIAVGPARGSAAASVVCWMLRITEIEPPLFPGMVFERFIDVTRNDLPDVDLDFDDARRDEVRLYCISKYGNDHVGNINNIVRYKGKSALKDVQRVYRNTVPYGEVEKVKKLVIERSGGDSRADAGLEDTFAMFPVAAEVLAKYPVLHDAIMLEGDVKSASIHAGGLVISTNPLTDITALYTRESRGRTMSVLAVDKYDTEYLGLMKADFLGLSTMGVISEILANTGLTLEDLYAIPLDDPQTLQGFKDNDVVGVFQFEGRATRIVCRDVSPDNFFELIDINAMARPGPLFSGATAAYIDTKHGRQPYTPVHPSVDHIVGGTRGQIIYQEQILRIVREVGGFPWTNANEIRRIIAKKIGEAAFNNYQEMFVEGAGRLHNIPPADAARIWKQLVTSGSYAFVYAHSTSYTMISLWQMYLKQHFIEEFYAATLRRTHDKHAQLRVIKDAHKHGIAINGPSLKSSASWSAGQGEVNAGLTQIKGIAEKTAARIAEYLDGDVLSDWDELLNVHGIGEKTVATIRAFAESPDPFRVHHVKDTLDGIRNEIRAGQLPVPMPTVSVSSDLMERYGRRVTWMGFAKLVEIKDTVEDMRSRSGDTVEEIMAKISHPDKIKSATIHAYDEGDEDVYLRMDRLHAYPRYKEALQDLDTDKTIVLASGRMSDGSFGTAIRVERLWLIEPDEEDSDEE